MDFSHIEPLNKEIPFEFGPLQTKWLEALESGNYKQTYGYLKTTSGYCCLGMLCELMGLEQINEVGRTRFRDFGTISESCAYVPDTAIQRTGLRNLAGAFSVSIAINSQAMESLASLNDHANLSFPEIAAYIRYDPHNVFSHAA